MQVDSSIFQHIHQTIFVIADIFFPLQFSVQSLTEHARSSRQQLLFSLFRINCSQTLAFPPMTATRLSLLHKFQNLSFFPQLFQKASDSMLKDFFSLQ